MVWTAHPIVTPAGMRGGALHAGHVYLWGDGVYRIRLPNGPPEALAEGDFEGEGCLAGGNLIVQSGGELLLLKGPGFRARSRIDSGVEAADLVSAELLGRRGVLATHRGLQVRHYMPDGANGATRWPYREIYSFYTASYQTGLLLRDVDGDGRPDILCGNYWIRSPESYDLPWRLFAINTWNEEPLSARVTLAAAGRGVVAAQGSLLRARVSVFETPADPTKLWVETPLDAGAPLRYPKAVASGDGMIAAAEGIGPDSRLVAWRRDAAGGYRMTLIHQGVVITKLWLLPGGMLGFGPGGLFRFEGSRLE